MKTNITLWMYTSNGTVSYPFCLLWSSIVSGLKTLVTSYDSTSGKITTMPRLFSKHLFQNENIRETVWYPFCLLWSSITRFRPENVSYKLPILQVVELFPYLDCFQNTFSKMKANIRLWMNIGHYGTKVMTQNAMYIILIFKVYIMNLWRCIGLGRGKE